MIGADESRAVRILYVDEPLSTAFTSGILGADSFALSTSVQPLQALSLLEHDFAVVIAGVGGASLEALEFLEAVRQLSPTSTRLVFARAGADVSDLPEDLVFRKVDERCPPELLRQVLVDAVNYHALLSASPVQPVEPPRRTQALLPPGGKLLEHLHGPLNLGAPLAAPIKIQEIIPRGPVIETPVSRVGLRLLGRVIELVEGTTLLGRSRTCHVPINDRQVSRRHACISNQRGVLTIKNVSSTNKLLVNGNALGVEQSQELRVGDNIQVGSQAIEVCSLGDYCPSIEPTQRIAPGPTGHDSMTLEAFSVVAKKYFLLGQSREAERILRPVLLGLIRHAASGQIPLGSDVNLAVDLALKLAEANRSAEWIDYLFDLYSALKQPAEQDVVDRLYRIIPDTPGIRIGRYRAYLEALDGVEGRFGPAQRFLVRRIQGLETRLMMSAHV